MRVPSPSVDLARMSAINVCPGGDLNVIARCRLACLVAAPLSALAAGSALAVDQVHDEIQVYNVNINDVGQWSYEQHLNFAVIGQKQPEFPGGFTSNRSLQGTPEFAYGITNWWEVGLYLPFGVSGSGEFLSNGTKLRSLFAVPDAGKRNFFYGVNFELSYEMPNSRRRLGARKSAPLSASATRSGNSSSIRSSTSASAPGARPTLPRQRGSRAISARIDLSGSNIIPTGAG